jgi:cytoskeletal protein RodZ
MPQLVQSVCPGCKHRLRIPAKWLHQPMRCKHCGMVVQIKQRAAAARIAPTSPTRPANRTPPPPNRTPPPPTHKVQVTAAPVARAIAPPAGNTMAAPLAIPVAQPVTGSPLAIPVAQPVTGSPFADIGPSEDDGAAGDVRRRRKKGGWWKGPALALAVLAIAGIVAATNWDRIAALLPPPEDKPVAQNDKSKDPVKEPSAKKVEQTKQPPTAKATPVSDGPKHNNPPKNDPPKNDPSKTPPKPPSPPKTNPPPKSPNPPRSAKATFPRRALIVSVHDYLYANPIQNGPPTPPTAHNFNTLIESLNRGLDIPLNQTAHLSDDATKKWGARAPTKKVIEETVTNFLNSSRAQDRIVLFFVGHSVEMEDGVYLAPIEGELDKAATLIPLTWFYEQLSQCKARQKVLVLDINRYDRTFGQERPGGEEMGSKLDALLKAPPAGVQVWSSCVAKQRSYASDEYPIGVFLDSLMTALNRGLPNVAQKMEAALPLEPFVARVNEIMKEDLSKRGLEQVSRLTGQEADPGMSFDATIPPAPEAIASLASAPADVAVNQALLEALTAQIGTPPVKVTHQLALRYDALPPFSVEALQKYQGDTPKPDSPLRKAVKDARVMLWAIYPGEPPAKLAKEVAERQKTIRVQLNVLKDGYRAPGGGNAEKQFKDMVEKDERSVALILSVLDETLEELQSEEVTAARKSESKRWKANYDFILARTHLERAYLFEYQSMLGSMRKEFPPRDPKLQGGWKLASQSRLQGDSNGKKSDKAAKKLLDKIAEENAGTPWEVLAKREKLTNLGLEWQAVR